MTLEEALKEHFGFDTFKGLQKDVMHSVLEGRDTFVIMPTGGGKSLCYQLPALMKEGTAIVISPLIALMKNQVDSIRSFGANDNIAHFLNSSLNKTEIFIAEAAHHIKTPLTVVKSESELALRKSKTPENRVHLRNIIRSVDQTSRSSIQLAGLKYPVCLDIVSQYSRVLSGNVFFNDSICCLSNGEPVHHKL